MSENGVLALLVVCAVLLVSILAVRMTSRTGLPSLLIYLVVGLAIGEAASGYGSRTTRSPPTSAWSRSRSSSPTAD